jgi:hypothetical protein
VGRAEAEALVLAQDLVRAPVPALSVAELALRRPQGQASPKARARG